MSKKNLRPLGVILFGIGVLIGFIFNGLAMWADFEASMFDSSLTADETFPGLKCPIFIGQDEEATIQASLTNSIDRPIKPTIRAHITKGSVANMQETVERPVINPGETVDFSWAINPENAVWGNFILFRVYQNRLFPITSKSSSCGVLVANMQGVSGNVITYGSVIASLVFMASGLLIWIKSHDKMNPSARNAVVAMGFLAAVVVLGLIAGLLGMVFIGALATIFSVLLMVVIIAYFISQQ
jgi:hypothetical protein